MQGRRLRHPKLGNLKWCYSCQQYKDIAEFSDDKSHTDGHHSNCKTCNQEYLARYYQEHKDSLLPRHRESALRSYHRRRNIKDLLKAACKPVAASPEFKKRLLRQLLEEQGRYKRLEQLES